MTQRKDHLNVNVLIACALSLPRDSCGSFDHVAINCQVGSHFAQSHSEHVVYVNNFQPGLSHDPYSNI